MSYVIDDVVFLVIDIWSSVSFKSGFILIKIIRIKFIYTKEIQTI